MRHANDRTRSQKSRQKRWIRASNPRARRTSRLTVRAIDHLTEPTIALSKEQRQADIIPQSPAHLRAHAEVHEQKFIRSVSFENGVLPGLRHGKYGCRHEAARGEASHHQGFEGRTRKKVRSLRSNSFSPPWIGRRERPRATVGQGGQVNAGATWVCPPVRPTSPMVIGSRASPPPTHRREDPPPALPWPP